MEQKDLVSTTHPLYADLETQRSIIRDVRGGTLELRRNKSTYLPKFPEELNSTYETRAKCSTLFNFYAKTENVMAGLVFQDEIKLGSDVPSEIKTLAENIDNQGNHLNIFAKKTFANLFDGASVILVDAPDYTNVRSLEEQRQLGLRPYWVAYKASDVINWQTRINPVSKSTELTLIVFKVTTRELSGRFISKNVTRYRVLFLNEQNQIAWELWRLVKENNNLTDEIVLEKSGVITGISRIPVAVVGSLDHAPPMIDLALLNVKHFQKESNFDNLENQAAVPLFYTKGLEKADGERFVVGADIHYQLSENGDIGWAQIDASGFDSMRASLKELVEQMAMLGLSMLADKTATVDVTATEALLNSIGETAELRVLAESLKDGIELCLGFTAEYLGLGRDAGGSIELGTAWSKADMAADVSNAPVTVAGQADAVQMVN